jgi:lysophospholipase L1-like esterase
MGVRREGGRTRWLPVGLVALVALGCGASQSGASGSPAPAGKLSIGVWPGPARVGHEAVVEIGDAGAKSGESVVECVAPPAATAKRSGVGARAGAVGPTPAAGGRTPSARATPPPHATTPAAAVHCSSVVLGAGGRASTRFAAKRLGVWRVSVLAGGERAKRSVEVVSGRLRMLATGDSEIQELDDMLGGDLAAKGVGVTGEAHISTGISKPFMFDWVKRAAAQAAGLHPDITVVFIGANDGFPLPAATGRTSYCCGQAWVAAFAKRTESMMSSYLRDGAGRVYWFTLPAPRNAAAQPVFRAINRAYAIAAASFPYGVELVDLVPVFTPGGVYRQDMTYDGRTVDVREPDGYHLSLGGDAIAAGVLLGRLRADGLTE